MIAQAGLQLGVLPPQPRQLQLPLPVLGVQMPRALLLLLAKPCRQLPPLLLQAPVLLQYLTRTALLEQAIRFLHLKQLPLQVVAIPASVLE